MAAAGRYTLTIVTALAGAMLLLALVFDRGTAQGQEVNQEILTGPGGVRYVPGELIVTYEEGLSEEDQNLVTRERGAQVEKSFPKIDAEVISFPSVLEGNDGLKQIKEAFELLPGVESVDYNYLRRASFVPSDPKFDSQYGLQRINAPEAWDTTLGSSGARIAVVDSGIDARHPDLNGKIAAQRDLVNDDARAEDDGGHGTSVAGVALAETNNKRGIAGVCPKCTLLAAKVSNDPNNITVADEIDGILWASNRKADVINLSLGAPGYIESERNAIRKAARSGAVIVASAGNQGNSERIYPAAYPEVIAVSATSRANRLASFSSRGSWVDIAAPGVDILTTATRNRYRSVDGTSFSAPHVAGVAGLLASQGRTPDGIRRRILGTAKDLGPDGRDSRYGHGLVDAERAVR